MGKSAEVVHQPPEAKPSKTRGPAGRPPHPARIRRRWLWRAFLMGFALGLFLAGLQQLREDVNTIRALFGV